MYSQSSNYGGYRRDCSGFVSMAWKLSTSHTTRTIGNRSNRVSLARLQPGDAILQPGHIQLFAGWVDRRRGTYLAIEESSRGHPARRKVKRLPRGAIGLRLPGITAAATVARSRRSPSSNSSRTCRPRGRSRSTYSRPAAMPPLPATPSAPSPPDADGGRRAEVRLSPSASGTCSSRRARVQTGPHDPRDRERP